MYIQSPRKEQHPGREPRPRQPTPPPPSQPTPALTSVRELTRFITSSTGDPIFKPWDNQEIRVKPFPSELDLDAHRIDLNQGFQEYWDKHCSQPKHIYHHQNGVPKGLEKDEVLRKAFEASLYWIKENHLFDPMNGTALSTTRNGSTEPTVDAVLCEDKADSPDSGHPPHTIPPPSTPGEGSPSPPTSTSNTSTMTYVTEHTIQVSSSNCSSLIQEELLADLLIESEVNSNEEEGLIPMQRSNSCGSAATHSSNKSSCLSSASPPLSLANSKPKLITTANSLWLLLQLPYESDERSRPCWLVSKYQGTLFLFSIESYAMTLNAKASPSKSNPKRNYNNNITKSKPHHKSTSSLVNHSNGHHYNQDSPAIQAEKASELIKYRTKVFFNLMTERLALTDFNDKVNRCVINEAFFDGHRILYSAIINAVNHKDKFVDLRLSVPKRTRREHLEKLQKVWSMAIVKPSTEVIIGTRTIKERDAVNPDEGKLIEVEKYQTSRIPKEVSDFTAERTTCEAPLWSPSVSFIFLKRFIDYMDKRVADDPKTVYQLIPEGFYGRGFSLLSIQKLNLKGCDGLIPDWFLEVPSQ